MQKVNLERFTKSAPYLGFGAALLILVIVNGYAVSSLNAVVRSTEMVARSVEVIDEVEDLLELLTNAETSQHAFVITGDANFLKPYRDAIAPDGVDLHLQQLRLVTGDNPAQAERLDRLEAAIVEKFALTEQMIALRQLYGFETARNLVANGTSQNAMGNVREIIEEIDMGEDQLLRERTAAEDARVQETIVALLLGVGLAVLISVAAINFFNREISQRRRAEQSVRQLNNELEARVYQRTQELEQANTGLREAEGRYRALVEQLPAVLYIDAVSTTDPAQYHGVYASPYIETLLGYTPDEVINDPTLWEALIHPEDRERVVTQAIAHYGTGGRLNQEYRMHTRDGRTIWVDDQMVMLPRTSPDWNYYQGIMLDITATKQAQEAMMQSEQRFRALIENSTDAISLLGMSGHLDYVSPSTSRILGYTNEEAIGADPTAFTHPDDLQILMPLLADLMQKPGATATAQYRFKHKDGSWRWVESFITNMLADPAVNAIVFNYRDITERRERARELETLVSVGAALRTAATRHEMIQIILDQVIEILHASGAVFETLIPATGDLLVEMGRGQWATATGEIIPSGGGLSAQVLATGQYYLNNNARNDPKMFRLDMFGTCTGMMGVPLLANNQIFSILWLCTERPLNEHDVHLVVAIAETAANAIQREAMHENSMQQLQRLAALRDIDQAITSSVDLRLTLNIIVAQTRRQLNADAVSILLLNKRLLMLEFAAGNGFSTTSLDNVSPIRLGEGYSGRAALERRAIYIENLQAQQDNPLIAKNLKGDRFASYYAIPLISKGQVVGVMELFQRTPLKPDSDWVSFFEALAGQTAIAVDSAQLFDGLQRSNVELSLAYDATIEGWSRAMDLRDKETEGHTLRVTDMTIKLATAMGIGSEEMVHIRRGALLHDIGKMGVPDNILLKPDKLTDDEWVHMRKHPEYAYEMLAPIDYLRPALDIPYCHHEKWDGTGYPRGLKGNEIPLSARIFAIVDVWDALRSDRPYRQGWPEAKVLEHIKSLSGTHFDPQLVETFLNMSFG